MRAFHTSSRNSQRGPPLARHKALIPNHQQTNITHHTYLQHASFFGASSVQHERQVQHTTISRSQQANKHEQPLAKRDTRQQLPKTSSRISHQMPRSPTDNSVLIYKEESRRGHSIARHEFNTAAFLRLPQKPSSSTPSGPLAPAPQFTIGPLPSNALISHRHIAYYI